MAFACPQTQLSRGTFSQDVPRAYQVHSHKALRIRQASQGFHCAEQGRAPCSACPYNVHKCRPLRQTIDLECLRSQKKLLEQELTNNAILEKNLS